MLSDTVYESLMHRKFYGRGTYSRVHSKRLYVCTSGATAIVVAFDDDTRDNLKPTTSVLILRMP